jgi:hypothetical protein
MRADTEILKKVQKQLDFIYSDQSIIKGFA